MNVKLSVQMYVRGPEGEDISGLVARVRLELDPSYAPHTMVELTQQPFHLTRRGWGEFRVSASRRNEKKIPLQHFPHEWKMIFPLHCNVLVN